MLVDYDSCSAKGIAKKIDFLLRAVEKQLPKLKHDGIVVMRKLYLL